MNEKLNYLLGFLVSAGSASVQWIDQVNVYGKAAALVVSVVVGLIAIYKFVEERFKKK